MKPLLQWKENVAEFLITGVLSFTWLFGMNHDSETMKLVLVLLGVPQRVTREHTKEYKHV